MVFFRKGGWPNDAMQLNPPFSANNGFGPMVEVLHAAYRSSFRHFQEPCGFTERKPIYQKPNDFRFPWCSYTCRLFQKGLALGLPFNVLLDRKSVV